MRKGGAADSERAKNSRSSTILDIVDDSLTISCNSSSCSQSPSDSSPISASPRITVTGVLSSWETSARNAALARAASASNRSTRFLSLTSREDVWSRTTPPPSASMGSGEGLEPGVFPRLLADTVDDGGGLLPFERLVVGLRADAFEILGVKKIVGAGAQKLFGLVAEQAPAGGADVDVAPVGLVQTHEVAHLLGEQPEAGLALAQRLLGSLALGDVPEGDNRADHRAAFPYGGARVFHGKVVSALRLKTSSLEECTSPSLRAA
jgi:hypothetical protein